MAAPSSLSSLLRHCALLRTLRPFSSSPTPISFTLSVQPEPEPESDDDLPRPNDDLRSRIFRLRFSKRSATSALEKWVAEGKEITHSELRSVARDLKKAQRYKHALEIMIWMESQSSFHVRAPDQASRLDLIIKVHSLADAEAYFDNLLSSSSQKAAAFFLLHAYVKEKDLGRAEAFMLRLHNSGLAVNPYLFNDMMKLYMAIRQFDKVLSVIQHMKLSKIPLNSQSYSLWLQASGEVSGVSSVELVYNEMKKDMSIEMGWSAYVTLANIFTKAHHFDKAAAALKIAEEKLSLTNRLAYSYIMTCYSNLKDRDGVLRLWESSKMVKTKITCADFMTAMLCLIKTDNIEEAERIFEEWELQCRNYDVRLSNILLGAYMRTGRMEKAEALHLHTLERGAIPNYKTWEILMEGWVKTGEMDKAVEAMKKSFSMLKGCMWRPPPKLVLAIAEYFEGQGNIEEIRSYMKGVKNLGLISLSLYKSALRAHIRVGARAVDIVEMMEKDEFELDEEATELVRCVKTPIETNVKDNTVHCPVSLQSFFARYCKLSTS